MGVSNSSEVRLLLQTFYSGMSRHLTQEEILTIENIATRYMMYIVQAMSYYVICIIRPETVRKLQRHWHLMSNTNTTDW